MAAKERKKQIVKEASGMSPERKEFYLDSRLPDIEAEIEFNSNYKTY
jgi:hypothetical protein